MMMVLDDKLKDQQSDRGSSCVAHGYTKFHAKLSIQQLLWHFTQSLKCELTGGAIGKVRDSNAPGNREYLCYVIVH